MKTKAEFIKSDKLIHEGTTYTGNDMVGKLCRAVKEKFTTLEVFRDGKLSMTFDVQTRADQSMTENDKGMKLSKYAPFDFGSLKTGA